MPQQQTSSPEQGRQSEQGQRFDWWAEPAAVPGQAPRPTDRTAEARAAARVAMGRTVADRTADRAPADGPRTDGPGAEDPETGRPEPDGSTEVYRSVQHSEAFQQIRHSYRAFVFPVSGVFLAWYLMYVAAQAVAPGLMRSPVAGPVNVAWLLGLLQFASTFLLTWLYARNARTKRDRAALSLRWDTQDQLR
ncbi:DUF485 domain-containing protein [Streptomyces sp. BE303]|uniref:DUF485 domain-containing protein n=1 Tax=Streptomyces sp. BE303 TaxID=3002528 RepID=UPI002E788A35|nr:DUF485 domain-containing protein [Streptomyces sp. BE303]